MHRVMSDVVAVLRDQDTAHVPRHLLSVFTFFNTVTASRVDVRCDPHCVLPLAQWASETYTLVQTSPAEVGYLETHPHGTDSACLSHVQISAPPWSTGQRCMHITLDTEHGETKWNKAPEGIPIFSVRPSHSDLKALAGWIEAGCYLGIAPCLREILMATYAYACVHMADPELNDGIAAVVSFQPHTGVARNIIHNARPFTHVVLPEPAGDDGL